MQTQILGNSNGNCVSMAKTCKGKLYLPIVAFVIGLDLWFGFSNGQLCDLYVEHLRNFHNSIVPFDSSSGVFFFFHVSFNI